MFLSKVDMNIENPLVYHNSGTRFEVRLEQMLTNCAVMPIQLCTGFTFTPNAQLFRDAVLFQIAQEGRQFVVVDRTILVPCACTCVNSINMHLPRMAFVCYSLYRAPATTRGSAHPTPTRTGRRVSPGRRQTDELSV